MSRISLFIEILQVATTKETQVYSLRPRTLINSSQIFSLRSFEIVAPKTLERVQKIV